MSGNIRLRREHLGPGGAHRFTVGDRVVHIERTGPDEIGIAFWSTNSVDEQEIVELPRNKWLPVTAGEHLLPLPGALVDPVEFHPYFTILFNPCGKGRWQFRLLPRLRQEKQIEDPAPEPEQEQLLQGQDGEAPAADPGIGTPGPLPDARLKDREVVEGVGGDAEREPWKLAFEVGAMISSARAALDDLQIAACHAITQGAITSGSLIIKRDGLTAEIEWPYSKLVAARLTLDGKVAQTEVEE